MLEGTIFFTLGIAPSQSAVLADACYDIPEIHINGYITNNKRTGKGIQDWSQKSESETADTISKKHSKVTFAVLNLSEWIRLNMCERVALNFEGD